MPRLSKAERLEVTELIKKGKSLREVAQKMNTAPSTIQRLMKRHNETGSIEDRPRSGRPKIPLIAESSWFECVGQKRSFVCTECGKTFNRYHRLKTHIQIHSPEKRYQCDQCGRGFYNNSTLKRHLRTHTGEKPYICEYCARGFADMGTMTTHIRTHTGERPHKCHLCDHACRSAGNLHHHMRVHRDKDGNIPRPINVQPTKAQAVPIFEGIDVLRRARRKYEQLNDGSWLEDTSDSESDEGNNTRIDSLSFSTLRSDNEIDNYTKTTFENKEGASLKVEFKTETKVGPDQSESSDYVKVKDNYFEDIREETKVKVDVEKDDFGVIAEGDIKQEPIEDE